MEMKSDGGPRFARSVIYQLESYIAQLHRSEHQDDTRQFIPMTVSGPIGGPAPKNPSSASPTILTNNQIYVARLSIVSLSEQTLFTILIRMSLKRSEFSLISADLG